MKREEGQQKEQTTAKIMKELKMMISQCKNNKWIEIA
jgi:hypothetical protein